MTIFARRSIQQMLDALPGTLSPHQLDTLVGRLNANNPQSLAAEWEISVLYGLTHLGRVAHERPLGGPRRADIFFQLNDDSTAQFAADVTCVSDRGLEDANPIAELMELIREKAHKLGIRSGGFDHRVSHEIAQPHGKPKLRLKLPEKKRLQPFFQTQIVPALKVIARSQATRRSLELRDDHQDIQITYDPNRRYTTASYPAFNIATAIDCNPLYNALDEKRKQLRDTGYSGLKGIVVCDGGCNILTSTATSWASFSKQQIIGAFFKRHRSISFVILLWVDSPARVLGTPPPSRVRGEVVVNPLAEIALPDQLRDVLYRLSEPWPPPVQNAMNARLELEGVGHKKAQPYWGHYLGEDKMGIGPTVRSFRMSARSLVEILAGHTSQTAFAEAHGFTATGPEPARPNPFAQAIALGFTLGSVTLGKLTDKDDDWIEFQMTGPDPAITRFRTPPAPSGDLKSG